MKGIAVLMCAVTATSAVSFTRVVHEEWIAFKLEHQKQYDTILEDQYRMKIYAENKRKVAKHNQQFARGLVGYTQKLNKYSDLTHREFVTAMNGYDGTSNTMEHDELAPQYLAPHNWTPPAEMDWRKVGAVTDVRDQGQCGSCWAFSANGALEGQQYRRTGRLVTLSEQNLIDCSRSYGNRGCRGGKMNKAYKYIKNNKGVDTDASYPYEAMDNRCRFNPRFVGAADAGYLIIPPGPNSEWTLKNAVASTGPISVAIHASLESFRHYESGVYDDRRCTARLRRNHAVLVVGYGKETTGQEYWLVKNSWGRSWGLEGYGKVARNHDNLCGISSEASYPIV